MPKPRSIDPSFWEDNDIIRLSRDERLLLVSIITGGADDQGLCKANAPYLKRLAFAFDGDLVIDDVERMIIHIGESCRNYLFYYYHEERYLAIRNWEKYQKIRYVRKSILPLPPWADGDTIWPEPDNFGKTVATLAEPLLCSVEQGSVGLGSEEMGCVAVAVGLGAQNGETTAAAAISEPPITLASHVYTTIDEGMGWKLAPNALEEIGALIDDYPEREWWDYALRECAISQTRNLRYLDKCLATAQENAQPIKPVEIREKRAGPPAEWNRVLETMYSTQTRASVDMWLGSATVEVIDKTLIIGPSTRNARDWITNRMAASITDAVGQALGAGWGWQLEEVDDDGE